MPGMGLPVLSGVNCQLEIGNRFITRSGYICIGKGAARELSTMLCEPGRRAAPLRTLSRALGLNFRQRNTKCRRHSSKQKPDVGHLARARVPAEASACNEWTAGSVTEREPPAA